MSSLRLADRLSAARHRRFVGRVGEKALFEGALAAPNLPFSILHVYGPGGVGKTALLHEFLSLCQRARVPAYYVDARNIEPTPAAFAAALSAAFHLPPDDDVCQALASQGIRSVLLIDTYETLAPLDDWLRDLFFPDLPEHVLVVLAGRNAPSPAWRVDLGWQTLLRTLPLRNLSEGESRLYLSNRRIPAGDHRTILGFTHGHPLALSLVADVFDQHPHQPFQPEQAPDVIKTLLEHFLQRAPGPAHRAALEVCALLRLTTEALLSDVLGMADVHELFDWLRKLSFIEAGSLGLFPHDLAREALTADLRWRNPDWYAELHRRARHYYMARLQQVKGLEQQRVLYDYVYLHRDNPTFRPFFEWRDAGTALTDTAREADWPLLARMVEQHEGAESARLARCWLARQPENTLVFRDAHHQPAGFLLLLNLSEAAREDLETDPATRGAVHHLHQHAPLRPGEQATLFRFWMARDTYQTVSAIQSLIFVQIARHYLTTPNLAFTFFPVADRDFWAPLCAYIDLFPIPEADFDVDGRRYAVFGHDWRAVPPGLWLDLLAVKEVASDATTPVTAPPASLLLVLSSDAFGEAVHDALRQFDRPDKISGNPLLRSRLVADRTGPETDDGTRIEALRTILQETAEALGTSPRDAKLYRALHRTYFHPASSQEQAAELLGLPFSTYRRHLRAARERVTELLWRREVSRGTAP